jgi:branched-chain amino acid transport system permease protein
VRTTANRRCLAWLALGAALAAYPRVVGIYYTNVFVTFAIFAVYSVSLNLLLGRTGLFSFGHAMFFGTGGYATALVLKHVPGMSLVPAILVGVVAASSLAFALCPIVTRLSGTAFAMLHLAFAQALLVLSLKLRSLTGGEDGMGNFPIPPLRIPGLFSLDVRSTPQYFYYFAIVVLALSLWLMWFLTQTPLGQIQLGIRDNARRLEYLGFRVAYAKAVVYLISAAFAGVAGSVYALFQNLVSPDGLLAPLVSIMPILNIMVGGIGTFLGPIWGAALFQILEEMLSRSTDRVELVMGLLLVGVSLFARTGLSGIATNLRERWRARALATAPAPLAPSTREDTP